MLPEEAERGGEDWSWSSFSLKAAEGRLRPLWTRPGMVAEVERSRGRVLGCLASRVRDGAWRARQ